MAASPSCMVATERESEPSHEDKTEEEDETEERA